MLEIIEKLLILQDRDRKLMLVRDELARIPPERQQLNTQANNAGKEHESAKHQVKHLESERKKLELDVEAKRQLIERYSLQQFQTKKNEEYRALAHEIDICQAAIVKIEDQELELMEQADAAQKAAAALALLAGETTQTVTSRLTALAEREQELQQELSVLETGRAELAVAVEDNARTRYERQLKNRSHHVVVGIDRGVCGGCHVQLSRQTVVHCQAEQDIVTCPNCGRILYFAPGMNLAVAE